MHTLPVVATILAAVNAALRADEQHFRVLRMDGNGPRLRHGGHTVCKLFPVRLTGFLTIQAMGFGTSIDIRFVCHTSSSLVYILLPSTALHRRTLLRPRCCLLTGRSSLQHEAVRMPAPDDLQCYG